MGKQNNVKWANDDDHIDDCYYNHDRNNCDIWNINMNNKLRLASLKEQAVTRLQGSTKQES